MKQGILFLLAFLMFHTFCLAQKDSAKKPVFDFYGMVDSFTRRVTTDPFPPIGKWKDVNGKEFNFSKINQSTIIRFGFRGCAPCKALMKSFIRMSELYPHVNFFYFTFDTDAEILEDISQLYPATGKVHFVSIPKNYIRAYRLAVGYPVTYFIGPENKVKAVDMLWRLRNEEIPYVWVIDSLFKE